MTRLAMGGGQPALGTQEVLLYGVSPREMWAPTHAREHGRPADSPKVQLGDDDLEE